MTTPKRKESNSSEIYISTVEFLESLQSVVPPNGGSFTIEALIRRLDRVQAFSTDMSISAKRNLVIRTLEISAAIKQGKNVDAFIGIHPSSGKLLQRRPVGVAPVGNHVIFEPA